MLAIKNSLNIATLTELTDNDNYLLDECDLPCSAFHATQVRA